MNIHAEHLIVERTARFFTLGDINNQTRSLTYVLHGYGHHPQYFLQWFKSAASKQHVIVAPEGLSRFYNQGINGRVGASWMTSDDREYEIIDYQKYLSRLHDMLIERTGNSIQVQIIGFSQGAATACRWVTSGGIAPDRLFLWAGMFPPDLEHGGNPDLLKQVPIIQVLSENDPYFDKGMLQNQHIYLTKLGIDSEMFTYDKEHKVYSDDLERLYQQHVPWWSDLF